jgi:uncharacterized membrane protein
VKRQNLIIFIILLVFLLLGASEKTTAHAQADALVVRMVLFYSPACGHCQIVIRETLPILIEKYGDQLEIIGIDITNQQGYAFFEGARQMFNLESVGVPFLGIGNDYLIGSYYIPNKAPALIEKYLAGGEVDWPDIPGLSDAIHASQTAQAPTPTSTTSSASQPTGTAVPVVEQPVAPPGDTFTLTKEVNDTVWQRIMRDPVGNGLAIVVLIIMVVVLVRSVLSFCDVPKKPLPRIGKVLIAIFCIIGLGVAGYLANVESTQVTAICGPVGDYNTVQQSKYARVFGVLPIGILGVIGYLLIMLGWGIGNVQNGDFAA